MDFFCQFMLHSDSIAVHCRDGNQAATGLTFESYTPGEYVRPFLQLTNPEAQKLADQLWSAGIRPSQGHNSEGVTAAQERHLTDMRAIAFAKLNIDTPSLLKEPTP